MECRFLENFTFGSLIAPFSEETFRQRYWEQQPLIVHRSDPHFYGDLFTLDDFDDAVTRSPSYVKAAEAVSKTRAAIPVKDVFGLETVLAEMRDGKTLILDQLHQTEPKLALLCRLLCPALGHQFQTNLYLTPPNGKGFTPHYDEHDVFILQVMGSKHWKIEKERRRFTRRGDFLPEPDRELRGELYSFTLNQGDLVYIPRGFVHAAECGSEPSLHITFGMTVFYFEDFLKTAITAAAHRDERLRVALPLGFMQGDARDVISKAAAALRQLADESFLGKVWDQFRDELVRKFPLDVSGQFVEFFRPAPLTVDDLVGPREGLVYRIHTQDQTVRLNVGTRTVIFDLGFRDALNFALSTKIYCIRDIPGELTADMRIAFVDRLMEEGPLVRKRQAEPPAAASSHGGAIERIGAS